jgi:hypothetical protein
MKHTARWLVAVALAAAPLATQAQQGQPAPDARQEGRRARVERAHRDRQPDRPFELLRRHRAELQLTDDQVARLEGIARRLEERNAPLRARLRESRQRMVAERRAMLERLAPEARRDSMRSMREAARARRVPEALRAPMEQMRAHQRAAMEEAQQVLTAEQKERARALVREHMRERRGEDGRRPRRRRAGDARP